MPQILLVSGSLRQESTNTALLRTAAQIAPEDVVGHSYERLASLPAFNPDDDHRPLHPEVERLRDAIHEADAVLFSTPEYAGALPGPFKNLLDNRKFFLCLTVPAVSDTSDSQRYIVLAVKRPVL